MRQFKMVAAVVATATVCLSTGVSAQEKGRILVQAGPIYNIPTGRFAGTDGGITGLPGTGFATNGVGYGARVLFPFSRLFSFYAEWNQPGFGTDVDAILTGLGIPTDTGLEFDFRWRIRSTGVGLRFNPPLEGWFRPYLQAGMARYRGEMEIVQDTYKSTERLEISTSASFGGGMAFPVGPVVLEAGARYHAVRFQAGGQTFDWPAKWIEAGLTLTFGIAL